MPAHGCVLSISSLSALCLMWLEPATFHMDWLTTSQPSTSFSDALPPSLGGDYYLLKEGEGVPFSFLFSQLETIIFGLFCWDIKSFNKTFFFRLFFSKNDQTAQQCPFYNIRCLPVRLLPSTTCVPKLPVMTLTHPAFQGTSLMRLHMPF